MWKRSGLDGKPRAREGATRLAPECSATRVVRLLEQAAAAPFCRTERAVKRSTQSRQRPAPPTRNIPAASLRAFASLVVAAREDLCPPSALAKASLRSAWRTQQTLDKRAHAYGARYARRARGAAPRRRRDRARERGGSGPDLT
eukprot:COSAG06_NODE_367_length_16758_cov_27.111651_3_plen_144_part_00